MATTTTTISRTPHTARDDTRPSKRKKEERKDIWSSLLRQTREAQARNSSSQSLSHRSLIVCGDEADAQRSFLESLARPPPPPPPGRRGDRQDLGKDVRKGQVKLSNRYAYGYGHLTLYSPPGGSGGGASSLASLGQEAEEVARIECHTIPEAKGQYEQTLRRLLAVKKDEEADREAEIDEMTGQPKRQDQGAEDGGAVEDGSKAQAPAVCILLSWKSPWNFLSELRAWHQLLARALLPIGSKDEDPVEVLKEFSISVSVVIQHTEAQEELERDGWKEERFDYVSQNLRTVILPLNAALVYTSSAAPPQQPGSQLSDVQKVVFTSLGLDLTLLSPPPARAAGAAPAKKEDLLPKHNVVDRMAICVPGGWDSAGKIRLLSETFSPEEVLAAWQNDLGTLAPSLQFQDVDENPRRPSQNAATLEGQTNAGAEAPFVEGSSQREALPQEEVFGTASPSASPILHPTSAAEHELDSPLSSPPRHPQQSSALSSYNNQIKDPQSHRSHPPPPKISTTYTPEQSFLSEMKSHLDTFAAQDAEKARSSSQVNNNPRSSTTGIGRMAGTPSGDASGALDALGDVSFNVGGVNYNTVGAEAAIASLRRPQQPGRTDSSGIAGSPRTGTPRPPGREREKAVGDKTPGGGSGKKDEVPVEELEKYFASLMKKGGGGSGAGSQSSTPTRH